MEDTFWKPWSWDVACLQFDDWVSDGLKPPTNSLNLLAVTSIEGHWKIPKSRAGDMKMIPVSQKFFHPISMTLQYTTNSFVANSDLLLTGEAEKSHLYTGHKNPPTKLKWNLQKLRDSNSKSHYFQVLCCMLLSMLILQIYYSTCQSHIIITWSFCDLVSPPNGGALVRGNPSPKCPRKKTV